MVKEIMDPDTRLTRYETARLLTQNGFPIKEKTLSTLASRGGGPPFQKFGNRVLHRWGDSISWAQNRLSQFVSRSSDFNHHSEAKSQFKLHD